MTNRVSFELCWGSQTVAELCASSSSTVIAASRLVAAEGGAFGTPYSPRAAQCAVSRWSTAPGHAPSIRTVIGPCTVPSSGSRGAVLEWRFAGAARVGTSDASSEESHLSPQLQLRLRDARILYLNRVLLELLELIQGRVLPRCSVFRRSAHDVLDGSLVGLLARLAYREEVVEPRCEEQGRQPSRWQILRPRQRGYTCSTRPRVETRSCWSSPRFGCGALARHATPRFGADRCLSRSGVERALR